MSKMAVYSAIIFLCFLPAGHCLKTDDTEPRLQRILTFANAIPYNEIGNSSDHPFGFYKGLIPYPPDDLDRHNIVHSFQNLSGKYIKIWAETMDVGAMICVQDNGGGQAVCGALILITKELRESVKKARSRQRTGYADRKEKNACDARMRKAGALVKDLNQLKSRKYMLEKLQEILKNDSEGLMMKAAADPTKVYAYAVEAKSTMNERKRKGQIIDCYAPSQSSLKFEFFCGESCQSSDVSFWYRFKLSTSGADDQWCTNQADEYPSSLRPLPSIIPNRKTTPKTPKTPANCGHTLPSHCHIICVFCLWTFLFHVRDLF